VARRDAIPALPDHAGPDADHGATEAEAHDKLAQLQSFTDQSNALAILTEQLAVDVSGFALDAPCQPSHRRRRA
jgi:hypothetical protein